MESLKFRASNVAYHLERLSSSKRAQKAVEEKDEEAFRETCTELRIPEKSVKSIMKIIFSSDSDPKAWPWD